MLVALALAAFGREPEFVAIPAGSFVMGCDPADACSKTLPRKKVEFERKFWMAKTEVSVRQFREFVKATGYRTEAEKAGDKWTWRSPMFRLAANQPAVYLSLNDASAYCEWVGARVPLEAEWEYAARAGTSTYHYWGEEIDGRYLWYFGNSGARPRPVGKKLPNAWGLLDVEGNAFEWVKGGGPHTSVTKAGWGSIRGGSWNMCPEPFPPVNGRRQRTLGLIPPLPGYEDGNFPATYRRYDTGVRCAK